MKILSTETQSHTKSLFNALHPATKTSNKVDETLVKNLAARKKNKWQKKNPIPKHGYEIGYSNLCPPPSLHTAILISGYFFHPFSSQIRSPQAA